MKRLRDQKRQDLHRGAPRHVLILPVSSFRPLTARIRTCLVTASTSRARQGGNPRYSRRQRAAGGKLGTNVPYVTQRAGGSGNWDTSQAAGLAAAARHHVACFAIRSATRAYHHGRLRVPGARLYMRDERRIAPQTNLAGWVSANTRSSHYSSSRSAPQIRNRLA